jgi:ADP-heptose:LPS heptosyltransferase
MMMNMQTLQPGDKILWIRFGAFGDVLQASASAHRFKAKYPNVRLTFLTRPEYADILRVQPYIDDLLLWDVKKRPLDFFDVVRRIRASDFKWLFSLHQAGSAAITAFFSRVSRRFGYNRVLQFCYNSTHWEAFDALGVDFTDRDVPTVFTTPENREKARSILSNLPEKKLFAVIGASKPQKFWPIRHWIAFLSPLMAEGWGVVLNGHGETEARAAKEIEEALLDPTALNRTVLNLAGRTPFPLMAAVAESCAVAVGNDTGPLHLASLVGTPTLGFFGATNAYKMGFRMPWFREVRVNCPDAGCWNYECPMDCLADVSPDRALYAFRCLSRFLTLSL